MRVLMFGWEYPPHLNGGLGTASYGLTTTLSAQGVEVILVLPKIFHDTPKKTAILLSAQEVSFRLREESLHTNQPFVKQIEIDSPLTPYLSHKSYATLIAEIVAEKKIRQTEKQISLLETHGGYEEDLGDEVRRYALAARHIASNQLFDVIHVHDWMTFSAGIEAKKVSNKPLVLHVHSTEYDRAGVHADARIIEMEKQGFAAADRIVTVSKYTKEMLISRYGVAEDRIEVIYNGVLPLEKKKTFKFKKKKGEYLVLFLGRVTMQKGPELFLEAAAQVVKKMKNVHFVMAGAGDLLPHLIERMASLRLEGIFHFTGFLGDEDREAIFAMSDLYVMPSLSEPFGLAPVEALQYGVPVIISEQSGVAEVLPHAVKVNFWNVAAMSDAIIDLLSHPAKAKSQVKQSESDLKNLTWEVAVEKFKRLYQRLLGKK